MEGTKRLSRTEVARVLGLTCREVERAEKAALAKLVLALRADRDVREWAEELGVDTAGERGEGRP